MTMARLQHLGRANRRMDSTRKIHIRDGVRKMDEPMQSTGQILSGGSFFGELVRRAEKNQPHDPSDYINPNDGLLYCGKCHTPKQCRVSLDLEGTGEQEFTPPVMCWCERERDEAREREARAREDLLAIDRLRSKSLMDERFRTQTFASYRTTKNNARPLRLCKRYVEGWPEMLEKNQGLLFYGGVGTGKTFSAACIANALLEKRVPVVMTSFVKLLESMQGFKEDGEKLIAQLNKAKLLIIDDLGAERGTDFALEKVYDIIDSRYRAKLPMLLTTNLELGMMQEATDIRYSRIYDRIFEVCYPVQFVGQSFRKTEAKRRFDDMKSFLEG